MAEWGPKLTPFYSWNHQAHSNVEEAETGRAFPRVRTGEMVELAFELTA